MMSEPPAPHLPVSLTKPYNKTHEYKDFVIIIVISQGQKTSVYFLIYILSII